jgi:hypothetical protein
MKIEIFLNGMMLIYNDKHSDILFISFYVISAERRRMIRLQDTPFDVIVYKKQKETHFR